MGNYSHTSAVTSKFHEQRNERDQCIEHWLHCTVLPGRATLFIFWDLKFSQLMVMKSPVL
jgi:hypothetical protein